MFYSSPAPSPVNGYGAAPRRYRTVLFGLACMVIAALPLGDSAATVPIAWDVTHARPTQQYDIFEGSFTDALGNTFVLGLSFTGYLDHTLIQFDPSGTVASTLMLADPQETGGFVTMTMDASGNIYAAGGSSTRVGIVRWNADGSLAWEETYDPDPGAMSKTTTEIVVDASGNVLVSGFTRTSSFTDKDAFVIKYDSAHVFQWAKSVDHGGPDRGVGIAVDASGSSYLCGRAAMPPTYTQTYPFLTKFGPSGVVLFSRTYTVGPGMLQEAGDVVHHAASGNLYLGASSDNDIAAFRVNDTTGTMLNLVSIASIDPKFVTSVCVDSSGNIYVAGGVCCDATFDTDMFLASFHSDFSGIRPGWPIRYDSGGDDGGSSGYSAIEAGLDGFDRVYLSGDISYTPGACWADSDLIIQQFTSGGGTAWANRYNPQAPELPVASAVITGDDGHPLVGINYAWAEELRLVKFDRNSGAMLWDSTYSNPNHCWYYLNEDAMTHYAGTTFLTMTGMNMSTFSYEFLLLRFDAAGNDIGALIIPELVNAEPGPMAVDTSGNIYISGYTYNMSTFEDDIILAKCSSAGTVLWTATHNFALSDRPEGIALDAAGFGYLVMDYPSDGVSPEGSGVLKFSCATGAVVWTRTIAAKAFPNGFSYDIACNGTDLLIVAADWATSGGHYSNFVPRLIKMDLAGNGIWDVIHPSTAPSALTTVDIDANGNAFAAGFTGPFNPSVTDILAASYGPTGNLRWVTTYDSGSPNDSAGDVAVGSLYLAGTTELDMRLIKFLDIPNQEPAVSFPEDVVVYPNPVAGDSFNLYARLESDASEITIDVFNSAFRRIYTGTWDNVTQRYSLMVVDGVLNWAPGVYIIKARATLSDGTVQNIPAAKVWVKR